MHATLFFLADAVTPADPTSILEWLKLINGPGGWLIAIIVLWKYIGKDLGQMHVTMSDNNRIATENIRLAVQTAERTALASERTAESHTAGSRAAEATVVMAKEIVEIAKDSIESHRERGGG